MLTHETVIEDLSSEFTTSIRVSVDPTVFTPTVLRTHEEVVDVETSAEPADVIAEPADIIAEPADIIAEPTDVIAEPVEITRRQRRTGRRRMPAPAGEQETHCCRNRSGRS